MKPKQVKKILFSEIKHVAQNSDLYCMDPQRNFSRNRKLSFSTVIKSIIGMESKNLTNELIDVFKNSCDYPSASAFVQQRQKIKPTAFKEIFDRFTSKILNRSKSELQILAVDGSDIQIPTNPDDEASFCSNVNGKKPYNLLHLNALYDLDKHLYTDAFIQGKKNGNEHIALQQMIDRSNIKNALIIADRGYESYNNMAHIQESGCFFLIRIKDGKNGIKNGLVLPTTDEFDVDIRLKLTRKQTNEMKKLFIEDKNHYKFIPHSTPFDYLPKELKKFDPIQFYELRFRIVRFKISEDMYETILTNLDTEKYPPKKLKELYAARWGIETSFRELKYTIGMLDFHSKKVMCIHQEIYAHLIMYNFAEMITSHVVIEKKQRKYTYKANFSVAAHMCRQFYHGKTASPDLEAIIARNIIPIRTDRHYKRNPIVKTFHGFLYRVA